MCLSSGPPEARLDGFVLKTAENGMTDTVQSFRRALWPCAASGVAYALALTLVFTPLSALPPPHVFRAPPVFAPVAIFLLVTAVALFLSWFYVLETNTSTIRVRAWSGRTVDIPWSAIETAKSKAIIGLPLLLITYSGAQRPAFIPLWLSDLNGFTAIVVRHAGAGNVLATWLVQHPKTARFRFI